MRNSSSDRLIDLATQNNNLSTTNSQQLAWEIAAAAEDKKAADIVLLKVTDVSYLADYFIVVTGFSQTQLRAISDAIEERVAEKFQQDPIRVSGRAEANWIVQDYGDAIVHIFLPKAREYYNLEAFWGHAERIEFDRIQPEE
ncbi:ribosome silencing factor [Myxosarcina sp. GI1]|uniref:ribosome silencing factor n=1 Tax=Myxosarcina sp. GI1 TaxID=1541065 RepID=UPI00056D03C7|nr:ribosome silencing factor [Myxosarcina sp. GI1]